MTDILQKIAEKTRQRVEGKKKEFPMAALRKQAENMVEKELGNGGFRFPFERAIDTKELSYICEIKKASPSKGVLDLECDYRSIARIYEEAGAAALSVLTEPYFFLGQDYHLSEVRQLVKIPLLRKDFTVDPYQIYEAKLLGADAILLIAALLGSKELKDYLKTADQLGISVVTEVHDQAELDVALGAGSRIIGVNNRNLKTFQVDIGTSLRLRESVPESVLFLSESGIRSREHIRALEEKGVHGVLIGETFMRSANKEMVLRELRGKG